MTVIHILRGVALKTQRSHLFLRFLAVTVIVLLCVIFIICYYIIILLYCGRFSVILVFVSLSLESSCRSRVQGTSGMNDSSYSVRLESTYSRTALNPLLLSHQPPNLLALIATFFKDAPAKCIESQEEEAVASKCIKLPCVSGAVL